MVTLLDLCVSSLRRGHANILCIVPILSDDLRGESKKRGFSGSSGPIEKASEVPWFRNAKPCKWRVQATSCAEQQSSRGQKNLVTLLDLCVSSLRRGHANLLCIVPIFADDLFQGSACSVNRAQSSAPAPVALRLWDRSKTGKKKIVGAVRELNP